MKEYNLTPAQRAQVETTSLRYDLRTPCKDCPFRKDVPLHDGVADSLPKLMGQFMGGDDAFHTCHKTDPRSDSAEGQAFRGPIQHCAGFLIMLRRSRFPFPKKARAAGAIPFNYRVDLPVYTFVEMVTRYRDHYCGRESE